MSLGLGVLLRLQLERLAVTPEGLRLLGDLPALGPLPEAARAAAGEEQLLRLGAAGLSLAAGAAAWLEYVLLRRAVRRHLAVTTLAGGQLGPIMLATLVGGAAASTVRLISDALPLEAAGPLAALVLAGVYAAVASALGVQEVRAVLAGLRRRLPPPRPHPVTSRTGHRPRRCLLRRVMARRSANGRASMCRARGRVGHRPTRKGGPVRPGVTRGDPPQSQR